MKKQALRKALVNAVVRPQPQSGLSFEKATTLVTGMASKDAEAAALQMVGQATGQAVQDATAYFQGVSAIAVATIAKASEMMLIQETTKPWSKIIKVSQKTVDTAATTLAGVGSDAAGVLKAFEKV